ncbi:MAG TPA: hypothetical protein PK747_01495 [Acidobacteriota bacterium]|jgi:PBP1b-binding outer membrane lipoprotein LpoB|nr:hypothetical protein [Acidobacteriota bacterium]HNT17102.1 hypothetical protein [Acidobacteriota bacterium]HPA26114.1 hypothetical protein [Acidobacteriota bacterium]HQO19253.1 hypothetical protein [Acidobacteriota bacterium]HQQ46065.1 hypothetical protein [Acidobacteriota bacterium]
MKKVLILTMVALFLLSCGKKGNPYPKKSLHDQVGNSAPAEK